MDNTEMNQADSDAGNTNDDDFKINKDINTPETGNDLTGLTGNIGNSGLTGLTGDTFVAGNSGLIVTLRMANSQYFMENLFQSVINYISIENRMKNIYKIKDDNEKGNYGDDEYKQMDELFDINVNDLSVIIGNT
jgi:hypothetical protein